MEITYRQGEKPDCQRIAELDSMASGGAAAFLFHDLVPDMSPEAIIASNLENDHYPHSYRSVIVAASNKKIVGMSLSFPGKFHGITEEMKAFFPEDRLRHFRHFFSAPVQDSYFLNALCVAPEFRGRGIGSRLIELTKAKALKEGYDTLSLIVFKDNAGAQKVYRRNGFRVTGHIELNPHALIPHEGGCVLMKAALSSSNPL